VQKHKPVLEVWGCALVGFGGRALVVLYCDWHQYFAMLEKINMRVRISAWQLPDQLLQSLQPCTCSYY